MMREMITTVAMVCLVWFIIGIAEYLLLFLKSHGLRFNKSQEVQLLKDAHDLLMGTYQGGNKIHTECGVYTCVYNPYVMAVIPQYLGSTCAVFPSANLIVYDNTFRKLSTMAQRVIIQHELGHTVDYGNHPDKFESGVPSILKGYVRIFAIIRGRVLEEELFADKFILRTYTKKAAVDALKELQRHYILHPLAWIEMRNRIKALEKV